MESCLRRIALVLSLGASTFGIIDHNAIVIIPGIHRSILGLCSRLGRVEGCYLWILLPSARHVDVFHHVMGFLQRRIVFCPVVPLA